MNRCHQTIFTSFHELPGLNSSQIILSFFVLFCFVSCQLFPSKFTCCHGGCRALLTQEGICLTLSPEFHFLEVAYPYVARRLLTAEDPILRERLFQVSPPPSPVLSVLQSLSVASVCLPARPPACLPVCLSGCTVCQWLSVSLSVAGSCCQCSQHLLCLLLLLITVVV